jgi:hypothetical protein
VEHNNERIDMINWLREAWAMHRAWGWIAEMDENGVLRPLARRSTRREGARVRLSATRREGIHLN